MRVLALHHRRTLEEVLRGDGKELRLVGEGVTVDVRSPAFDLGHLAAHEVNPRPDGLTIESHTWHPVDGTVGLVDMGVFPLLKSLLPVVVAFLLPTTDTLDHRRVGNGTHRHGLFQEPMEELPAMA